MSYGTGDRYYSPGLEVIKLFMLTAAEHEILNAHNYKISRIQHFFRSDDTKMLFFLLINAEMPIIVVISTLVSGKNFILSLVKHEKAF